MIRKDQSCPELELSDWQTYSSLSQLLPFKNRKLHKKPEDRDQMLISKRLIGVRLS